MKQSGFIMGTQLCDEILDPQKVAMKKGRCLGYIQGRPPSLVLNGVLTTPQKMA